MNRQRLLTLTLVIAGLLVLAFAISFFFGLRERRDARTPPLDREDRIEVEVLNAGGRAGLARQAVARLRREGFDVVSWGNASEFTKDSSVVIDRVGKREQATAVARALGITRVTSAPDPDLFVDVSVRLGPEWGTGGEQERGGLRGLLPD